MDERTWYRLLTVPAGDEFDAFLDWAVARRNQFGTFLLVQRMRDEFEPAAAAFLERLEQFLIATVESDQWPGTQRDGAPALLRFYRLDRQSASILKRIGALDAFRAPHLPEDLCILALNKTPWLATSTRAERFFLHLSEAERRSLEKVLPWIRLFESPKGPA